MHDIKEIRKNPDLFAKKISERNINIDIKKIIDLDKKNRELIQNKEKLEQEKKIISKKKDKRQFSRSKKISKEIQQFNKSQVKLKSKIGLIVKTKGKKVKSDCLNFRIFFLSKINKNIKNAINMMTDWYLNQKDIARKNPINKKSGIVFCFFVIKYNEINIKKSGVISFNTIIDRNAIFALTAKNNCVSSATFLSKRFFVIKYERNTIPVPLISEIIFPAVNASPSRLPRVT